jgi:hypothetical protein
MGVTQHHLSHSWISENKFSGKNKHITFENKPTVFENCIKSDLINVNDILDSTKTLSSKFILEKLKFKSNWIVEFNIVNKSIPMNWTNITKTENSVKVL